MEEWTEPIGQQGRPLSPFETSTGVVLPIWTSLEIGQINRHHAHFYARQYESGSDAVRAVRFSRLQKVLKKPHADYHDYYDGTQQPEDSSEAFKITLLNCSQYIPSYAVDMTRVQPEIIELSDRQTSYLRQPDLLTIEKNKKHRDEIGSFLMRYAISQDFGHEKEHYIEEFLSLFESVSSKNLKRQERMQWLGMKLTNTAIDVAVEPVQPEYKRARDICALPVSAPGCAFQALKNYVRGYETDYFDELRDKLALQYSSS